MSVEKHLMFEVKTITAFNAYDLLIEAFNRVELLQSIAGGKREKE